MLEQKNSYLKFQLEQLKSAIHISRKESFISWAISQASWSWPAKSYSYWIGTNQREKHQDRKDLPSHLSVNKIVLALIQNIEGIRCIYQKITDELEYAPAINRYIKNKYIAHWNEKANQNYLLWLSPDSKMYDRIESSNSNHHRQICGPSSTLQADTAIFMRSCRDVAFPKLIISRY